MRRPGLLTLSAARLTPPAFLSALGPLLLMLLALVLTGASRPAEASRNNASPPAIKTSQDGARQNATKSRRKPEARASARRNAPAQNANAKTRRNAAVAAGGAAVAGTALAAGAAARERERERDGHAEAQLIEVYRLIGQSRSREALDKARRLVDTYPNFQLGLLVYGDLLSAQVRPLRGPGDVPEAVARAGAGTLAELREESALRLKALRERPPAGHLPEQFVQLPTRTRHAIAVDTSRARLYLFENSAVGPRLVADYYISVGKAGVDKSVEGDLRTPLGVYFITSNLDPKTLRDFYGSGALPINYPNPIDQRLGRTGSGIWLHGTPPNQFARAPRATDGCIVLSNPDLERLLRTVEPRSTPVVIATQLNWVRPEALGSARDQFMQSLEAWRQARASGDVQRALGLYSPDFRTGGRTLAEWQVLMEGELRQGRGRDVQLKDLSLLAWRDTPARLGETMVVTFGEVREGARSGVVRRQYWQRAQGQWKIIFEGVIG